MPTFAIRRGSSRTRAAAALLLVLLFGLQPAHAQPGRTPRQLIDRLGIDVRNILEDPKSKTTPEDAERAVASQITALIASSEGHLALTELDERGRTPLMLAVGAGYPLVVRALLADPSVRLVINVPDEAGETAWMLANFAPTITLMACQPGALTAERYVLLPPYLRRLAHLLKTEGEGIVGIVRDLEAAGAEAKPDEARRAWLARCHNTAPELREALPGGNLLTVVIHDALTRLGEFNKTAQANPSSLPVRPPADMKFVRDADGKHPRPASPLLQIREMRCTRMDKPQLPGAISWSGEIMFRVVVTTRAGVVETADFTQLVGTKEKRVADFFRGTLLRALAGYQCEGDHVFEQEFQFLIR